MKGPELVSPLEAPHSATTERARQSLYQARTSAQALPHMRGGTDQIRELITPV